MKSYYSVSLVVIFAFVMSIMAVVHDAIQRQEISTADAAVIALTIGVGILAFRLSQAEKRIAHLENQVENNPDKHVRQSEKESMSAKPFELETKSKNNQK
jgi:hypothetical protein